MRIFFPMGLGEESWPVVISILSGILSKEAVLSTLISLYNNENNKYIVTKKILFHKLQKIV